MKAYVFNGERWHLDDRPVWCRIRRWLVCVGLRELKNGRLSADGELTPFGRLVRRIGLPEIDHAYISVNGTPQNAHTWLMGAPINIVKMVNNRGVA